MSGGIDPSGVRYDWSHTGGNGITIYERDIPGGGRARWSSEHDCNPICGCHLASKCIGCGVCTSCDGCYCNED
jgi:hypothetical protein